MWVPNIRPTIKKEFIRVNNEITLKSSQNLKIILYQNKQKLLLNTHPGLCQLDCSYNGKYIGESKNVFTCCMERQQYSIKGNCELSATTKHRKESHPKTISIMWICTKESCELLQVNRLKTLNEIDKIIRVGKRHWWIIHHHKQLETTFSEKGNH